jgi:PA14 domain
VLDLRPSLVGSGDNSSALNSSLSSSTRSSDSPLTIPASTTQSGLRAEYFDQPDFVNPVLIRVDTTVNFDWGSNSPDDTIAPDTFSVRWTGQVRSRYSETYTFHTVSDDGIRLWVNGQLIIDNWTAQPATENTGTIALAANQDYDIKLEYFEQTGASISKLYWSSASQLKEIVPQSQLSTVSFLEQTIPGRALTQYEEYARSADSFVDSLGVATHLRYTDTSYNRYSDVVEPRLVELGIRHIRDGGNNPEFFEKLNRLGSLGIYSTLVMDPRDNISPTDAVEIVKRVAPSVEAIEGPNEWDVHLGVTYQGRPFPYGIRQYQTELYRALKSDSGTSSVPVIAPSLAMPENSSKLGALTEVADIGNLHSYAGGNAPTTDYDWRWLPSARAVTSDRPIIVTETGWHNAVNDPNASQKGVSEQVASKYITRQYLENFDLGIQRTFIYELLDERPTSDQEDNFGLIRYDGTPKPAFYAIKNLTTLLKDTPGSTVSGKLDFSMSGNTENIRHTLLQKSNGEFFLALWLHTTSTDATVSQSVTLNFPSAIAQAETYLPNRSEFATGVYSQPGQLTLDIPDEPLLIKLTS